MKFATVLPSRRYPLRVLPARLCVLSRNAKRLKLQRLNLPPTRILSSWETRQTCLVVRICTAIIVAVSSIVKGKFAMAVNNRSGILRLLPSDASQTEFACRISPLYPMSVWPPVSPSPSIPSSNGTPCCCSHGEACCLHEMGPEVFTFRFGQIVSSVAVAC